jgi:hypothetical protein
MIGYRVEMRPDGKQFRLWVIGPTDNYVVSPHMSEKLCRNRLTVAAYAFRAGYLAAANQLARDSSRMTIATDVT